jgi:hypothetical protein
MLIDVTPDGRVSLDVDPPGTFVADVDAAQHVRILMGTAIGIAHHMGGHSETEPSRAPIP